MYIDELVQKQTNGLWFGVIWKLQIFTILNMLKAWQGKESLYSYYVDGNY